MFAIDHLLLVCFFGAVSPCLSPPFTPWTEKSTCEHGKNPIHGVCVDTVEDYKYLGLNTDNKLDKTQKA